VETDAPFLTPEPHRTVRPNAPRFVVHVADALAALWGRDAADVRRELDETARAFFGLPAESDLIVQ
jgi:Tat protein secretion system quality control protein TatD with DNase activity